MLFDIDLDNDFLDMTLNTGNETKIDKYNYFKLKNFCITNRMKSQPMGWGNIFANHFI